MNIRRFAIVLLVICRPSISMAEDLDSPFEQLSGLQEAKVPAFKYNLLLRAVRTRAYPVPRVGIDGITLQIRGESQIRTSGNDRFHFVEVRANSGPDAIDLVAVRDHTSNGQSFNPSERPALVFRGEIRGLQLDNKNEAIVRIRFVKSTDYFTLRYRDGQGLLLEPLEAKSGAVAGPVLPEFKQIERTEGDIKWRCNPITTWATSKGEAIWSTEVPMEGQPALIKSVGDLLLISTSVGHSFYIRKNTGQIVFYDKSILPGVDPFSEIIASSQSTNSRPGKDPSYAQFINALVALDDRRAIPFLIDWIEKGFGLQEKAMAVAALDKFNGNSDLWEGKNLKPGEDHFHRVGMHRVYPEKNREAEISKWRDIFREELTAAAEEK